MLTLRDGRDLTVTLSDGTSGTQPFYGSSYIDVFLSSGFETINGGNENDSFYATKASLTSGDVLNGGGGFDSLNLQSSPMLIDPVTHYPVIQDSTFDFRDISVSAVESLNINGSVLADTDSLAGFTSISGGKLQTADTILDLSGKYISGTSVESTNTTGTTFTVSNAQSAFQIVGGTGQDTLVVQGLTLTEAQRDQIFQGSIEAIQDAGGAWWHI
jgi:hypothetical protein